MKITEPKTPYVRYNAETDTIEGGLFIPPGSSRAVHIFFSLDIPTLDLGLGYRAPSPLEEDQPVSPTMTLSSTGADASAPSSRRTSFSSSGRPGTSMSGSSSRSTSFNLPHESRRGSRSRSPGGEVDFEEDEMDEEGTFVSSRLSIYINSFDAARKKHAEFLQARGRHYSNEAEAMKVFLHFFLRTIQGLFTDTILQRAKELMAEDDDENPEIPPVPSLPSVTPEDDEEGESMESEYIGEVKAAGHIEDIGEVNGIKPNTTTSGV